MMTREEKQLLLVLATCVLSDLTVGGPDVDTQIRVLRKALEPFRAFMREDMEAMRRERSQ